MGDKAIEVGRLLGWTLTKNPDKYGVDAFLADGRSVEFKLDFRAKDTGNLFHETTSKGRTSAHIRSNSDVMVYIFEWDKYTVGALCPRDKIAYHGYKEIYVPSTRNTGHLIPVSDYLRWCSFHGEIRRKPCNPPFRAPNATDDGWTVQ